MTKIFIDAGHGGKDSGATTGNTYEKDIALKIALKLNDKLKQKFFKTELTRKNDVFVELSERCRKANKSKADIFVSIHLNSAANTQANGIETLVYTYKGETKTLADDIQQSLIAATHATDRGVKTRPDLAVLNGTTMPAVLIETGFISNTSEKNLLVTEDYQDKIVQAIVDGIVKYFGWITTSEEAILYFQSVGVMDNPDYWRDVVKQVKFVDALLIKLANKAKQDA